MSSRFNDDYFTQEGKNRQTDTSNNKYISLMKLKKLLNNLDTTSETNQQPLQPPQQPLPHPQQIIQQIPNPISYGYQQPIPQPIFGFQQPQTIQTIQPQNTMELSANARMEIQNMIDRQSEITEKNMKEYVTLNSEKLVSYIKELLQYNQTVEQANRLREEEQKKKEQKASDAANTTNSILSVVPDSITSAFNKIKNAMGPSTSITTPPTTTTPTTPPPTTTTPTVLPTQPNTQPAIQPIQNNNSTAQINTVAENNTLQQSYNTSTNNTTTSNSSSRLSLNNNTPPSSLPNSSPTSLQTINTETNTIDEDLDTYNNINTKPITNTIPTSTTPVMTNTNINDNNKPRDIYNTEPSAPKFDYNAAENELNEKKKKAMAQEQLNRVNSEMENLGFMKGGMKSEDKQKKRSKKKNNKRKDKSKKKMRK